MRAAVASFAIATVLIFMSLAPMPSALGSPLHTAQTPKAAYLAAASKVNKSQLAFNSLTTNAPISSITKAALRLASAFITFSNTLKHIHFPRAMQHDVRTLETHMQANASYLRSITVQTSSTIGSWNSQFVVTTKSATSAINAVRHDLGLSVTTFLPSTTTTTTTTTTPQGASLSPSESAQLLDWYQSGGSTLISGIQQSLQLISSFLSSGQDGIPASCESLKNTVHIAQGATPVPISRLETGWANALTIWESASTSCADRFLADPNAAFALSPTETGEFAQAQAAVAPLINDINLVTQGS